MRQTLIGTIHQDYEVIERTLLEDGRYKSILNFGGLIVTSYANTPSEEALQRAADTLNKFAAEYVDKECRL